MVLFSVYTDVYLVVRGEYLARRYSRQLFGSHYFT